MVLDDHEALTPAGNPVAVPIPVAPVVVWVILVKAALIQTDGEEEAAPVVLVFTVVAVEEVAVGAVQPFEV